MSEKRIKQAFIQPAVPAQGIFKAKVIVTYTDKSTEQLFDYYVDELHFKPEEFKGLTREEGKALFVKKDKEYLQS